MVLKTAMFDPCHRSYFGTLGGSVAAQCRGPLLPATMPGSGRGRRASLPVSSSPGASSSGVTAASPGLKRKKSANFQTGSNDEAELEMIDQIQQDMLEDRSHILPVYSLIQKRKKARGDADEDLLKCLSRLECTSIKGLPDDVKINWISSRSDLSTSDLVQMLSADNSVLNQLMSIALQLNIGQKLADKMLYMDILDIFMDDRYKHCGERLGSIKARGGVSVDHKLVLLRVGAYQLKFEGDILSSIRHFNGDEVAVQPEHHLTRKHALVDNGSDWQAALVLKPLPPVYLCSFFEEGADGPYKYQNFIGGPKELAIKYEGAYDQWEKKARAAIKDKNTDEVLQKSLDELNSTKKKAAMDKARDMAKKAMQDRAKHRDISLIE